MTDLTQATIIRENDIYRITSDKVLGLFLEGKNKFGRWVIIQSLSLSKVTIEEAWEMVEDTMKHIGR